MTISYSCFFTRVRYLCILTAATPVESKSTDTVSFSAAAAAPDSEAAQVEKAAQTVQGLISQHRVVVFGWQGCPYTAKARKAFEQGVCVCVCVFCASERSLLVPCATQDASTLVMSRSPKLIAHVTLCVYNVQKMPLTSGWTSSSVLTAPSSVALCW